MRKPEQLSPKLQAFYWHPPVIAATCSFLHACVYIEIGVSQGVSLRWIAPYCAVVHGVDIRPESHVEMPPGGRYWSMPSDEFFRVYDGPAPNVVFVDGDHSYEQAKRDFENALRLLAKGGVIFLHDTWPRTEQDTDCGTVWQLADEIAGRPELESFTWPFFPGLTAVRRRGEGVGAGHVREADALDSA